KGPDAASNHSAVPLLPAGNATTSRGAGPDVRTRCAAMCPSRKNSLCTRPSDTQKRSGEADVESAASRLEEGPRPKPRVIASRQVSECVVTGTTQYSTHARSSKADAASSLTPPIRRSKVRPNEEDTGGEIRSCMNC